MTADREQIRANLADQIVAGIVKSSFDPMDHLDKFDRDDIRLMLFRWHDDEALEALSRISVRAIELAAAWLDSDPRGAFMLDEAIEKEEELRADVVEMNAREVA